MLLGLSRNEIESKNPRNRRILRARRVSFIAGAHLSSGMTTPLGFALMTALDVLLELSACKRLATYLKLG
jgi:hypothetical protein